MITEYVFTESGALAYSRECNGPYIYTVNHRDEMGVQQLCSVFVSEDLDAYHEFFTYFGDDSSWPPGWYAKVTTGKFTRLSWQRENYPVSKVSWQEYFGVHCPKWYI